MDLGEALISRLGAASAVTAIVPSTRIYWIFRPQGTEVPAIVLRYSGGIDVDVLDADQAEYFETRVTIDCFGRTNFETKKLARAVKATLRPAATVGSFSFDNSDISQPIDLGEAGVAGWQHRASLDCVIRHGAET